MRETLENQIYRVCPTLFRAGLAQGIQCGDGWFAILEELSLQLEALCVAWPREEAPPRARLVARRRGGLRFDLSLRTPATAALVERAAGACARTCEICGTPGGISRVRGALKTLCPWCLREIQDAVPDLGQETEAEADDDFPF